MSATDGDALKRVVRCAECSNAAVKHHFGFTGTDELYCSGRSGTVDHDDGCTFGVRGQPMIAVVRQDVDISKDAAVRGW